MNCEICGRGLRGEIAVLKGRHPSGKPTVRIIADPDRDWIECDGCSRVICRECCEHPKTGLCDRCLQQGKLFEELQFVESCPIDELEEFMQAKRKEGADEQSQVH
jgi:hypothetical protein